MNRVDQSKPHFTAFNGCKLGLVQMQVTCMGISCIRRAPGILEAIMRAGRLQWVDCSLSQVIVYLFAMDLAVWN
jgi:hypothetical protein